MGFEPKDCFDPLCLEASFLRGWLKEAIDEIRRVAWRFKEIWRENARFSKKKLEKEEKWSDRPKNGEDEEDSVKKKKVATG